MFKCSIIVIFFCFFVFLNGVLMEFCECVDFDFGSLLGSEFDVEDG